MAEEMEKSDEEYMRYVDPKQILPNDENPRLIFDPTEMKELEDSIKEVGILVPLIVFLRDKDSSIVLLDGERRLTCALELKLPRIPVYCIEEPNDIENILRMFNIHNVRAKWQPMPTALKLESLMDLLGTKSTSELAKKTGLSPSQVTRCKKLLSYDQKYRDMVLQQKLKPDFLVELRPFLNLINRSLPEIWDTHSEDEIIKKMIKKWEKGTFKDVTDFRYASSIIRAKKKGADEKRILGIIETLINDSELSPQKAYDISVKTFFEITEIINKTDNMAWELSRIDIESEDIEYRENFIRSLKALKVAVDGKLKEADNL